MPFEKFMRAQYQWDDQFDMKPQYSQLDMEAAFNAGRKSAAKESIAAMKNNYPMSGCFQILEAYFRLEI